MSNFFDNGSQQNHDSQFDNLMQSLGIDPQHDSSTQHFDNSLPDFSQPQNSHADSFNFHWDLGHFDHHSNLHDAGVADLTPSSWDDSPALSFEHQGSELQNNWQEHHQTDWNNSLPNIGEYNCHQRHQNWHESANNHHIEALASTQDFHSQHSFASGLQVMNSSDNHRTYTTINNNGGIYKHLPDGSNQYAGYVDGREVYNSSNYYLGYAGTNGKIYDKNDHCVGWVDGTGHVYNKAGIEVYETTKGVVGGAAFILIVYLGGVT